MLSDTDIIPGNNDVDADIVDGASYHRRSDFQDIVYQRSRESAMT
jgi:hypothetical protein